MAFANAGGKGGTPAAATGTITAPSQSITAADQPTGITEQLTGLIRTNIPSSQATRAVRWSVPRNK